MDAVFVPKSRRSEDSFADDYTSAYKSNRRSL
jgi:hypothetical protein